jgi:hypothetical protein
MRPQQAEDTHDLVLPLTPRHRPSGMEATAEADHLWARPELELRSLQGVVSPRTDDRLQFRSDRGRTTRHVASKRCRASTGAAAGDASEEGSPSARNQAGRGTADGARRLRARMWHAKRFSMGRPGFALCTAAHRPVEVSDNELLCSPCDIVLLNFIR